MSLRDVVAAGGSQAQADADAMARAWTGAPPPAPPADLSNAPSTRMQRMQAEADALAARYGVGGRPCGTSVEMFQ